HPWGGPEITRLGCILGSPERIRMRKPELGMRKKRSDIETLGAFLSSEFRSAVGAQMGLPRCMIAGYKHAA
ncbi:MAG TPA: hypothetical protein VFV83_08375, partial [Chthoniobacteraceae bacterium]|nr:hypothetical protein [Chthoniobacteraceae bacterium]